MDPRLIMHRSFVLIPLLLKPIAVDTNLPPSLWYKWHLRKFVIAKLGMRALHVHCADIFNTTIEDIVQKDLLANDLFLSVYLK